MGFLSSLKLFSSPKSSSTSHANDKMKIDEMARFKEFGAKRIRKELEKSNEDPLTHCSYGVVGKGSDDIFRLQGAINIMRPCDTPFEGGLFFLSIELPYNYPFGPPKITFQTKVFHPNLGADGKIQIDILGKKLEPLMDH
ncbi:hypothetical protein TIFTF001_032972 [Ficus carica]|uniref:UBC core domain-containing protein n=1 Tax=Ficus carica TaxID=3494 RepID=A0AA88DXP2_FICCA|nr:hypothetical protein TIFTF001_032972 [Ficus carica]